MSAAAGDRSTGSMRCNSSGKTAPRHPSRSLSPASGDGAGLVRFVQESREGERNARLYWAARRAVDDRLDPRLSEPLPRLLGCATARSAARSPQRQGRPADWVQHESDGGLRPGHLQRLNQRPARREIRSPTELSRSWGHGLTCPTPARPLQARSSSNRAARQRGSRLAAQRRRPIRGQNRSRQPTRWRHQRSAERDHRGRAARMDSRQRSPSRRHPLPVPGNALVTFGDLSSLLATSDRGGRDQVSGCCGKRTTDMSPAMSPHQAAATKTPAHWNGKAD